MKSAIGIHGEPGRERTKLKSADEIAAVLTMLVLEDETYTVYKKAEDVAKSKSVTIERKLIGPYITSPGMQGVSVTLVKTTDEMFKHLGGSGRLPFTSLGRGCSLTEGATLSIDLAADSPERQARFIPIGRGEWHVDR